MTASITLIVIKGRLIAREFVFTSPKLCLIGRADDCHIWVPPFVSNGGISRYHCLLDVDPPLIRACDLSSRNGTYVNGMTIGHREPGQAQDEFDPILPGFELSDGDELSLGDELAFRVSISPLERDLAGVAAGLEEGWSR